MHLLPTTLRQDRPVVVCDLLVPIMSGAEEEAVGGRSEGPRGVAYWLVCWLVGDDGCVFPD